ncbi:MAG: terminase small subunit [Alphaproteobacteria bacterium]|nr:terminase small subunit [Alphaproteobacteria bacterium]
MSISKKLNDRERLFVREYLIDLNATQAAIRAGYARNTAGTHAHRVFNRPRVKAAIEAAMAGRAEKLEITADRVLRELALMGFANLMDYFKPQADGSAYVDLSRLTRDQATALVEIQVEEFVSGRGAAGREVKKTKVKLADKSRNLELVGKHLGLFARKSGENAEEGERENVKLSDTELAQRILGIIARGQKEQGGPADS